VECGSSHAFETCWRRRCLTQVTSKGKVIGNLLQQMSQFLITQKRHFKILTDRSSIIIVTLKYKRDYHAYQIMPLFSLEDPGFQEHLRRVVAVRRLSFCKNQLLTSLTLGPSASMAEVLELHQGRGDPRT